MTDPVQLVVFSGALGLSWIILIPRNIAPSMVQASPHFMASTQVAPLSLVSVSSIPKVIFSYFGRIIVLRQMCAPPTCRSSSELYSTLITPGACARHAAMPIPAPAAPAQRVSTSFPLTMTASSAWPPSSVSDGPNRMG